MPSQFTGTTTKKSIKKSPPCIQKSRMLIISLRGKDEGIITNKREYKGKRKRKKKRK
jgi:hypothetical protein